MLLLFGAKSCKIIWEQTTNNMTKRILSQIGLTRATVRMVAEIILFRALFVRCYLAFDRAGNSNFHPAESPP